MPSLSRAVGVLKSLLLISILRLRRYNTFEVSCSCAMHMFFMQNNYNQRSGHFSIHPKYENYWNFKSTHGTPGSPPPAVVDQTDGIVVLHNSLEPRHQVTWCLGHFHSTAEDRSKGFLLQFTRKWYNNACRVK